MVNLIHRVVVVACVGACAIELAPAAVVSSLPATPSQVFNTAGNLSGIGDGNGTSFDSVDYAAEGVVNGDTLDATFAMTVTFQDYSTADRQTLWETGGGTIGTSLNYEAGNVLVLRMSGDDGGGGGSGLLEFSSAPITPGTYDLIWTIDIDGATPPTIALYIDGGLSGSDTHGVWNTNDWSGSGGAALGQQSGNMAGNSLNANLSSVVFTDGNIDLARGLEFYADTLFVPEPGSLALICLGGLMVTRRRRA